MDSYSRGALTFPVLDQGPEHAPGERTVVLLHGFPQTNAAWSGVTPALHEAGLRTLAPDSRGTAPGARPSTRAGYRVEALVADVVALLDAAGLEGAHLVGHDWGAGIAWEVARRRPDRVLSLTALSVPHPAAMTWASQHSTQLLRSSYMIPMQIPLVPERLGAVAVRRGGLTRLGLPREHERAYTERFSDPAAFSGALGLYRGLLVRGANDSAGNQASRGQGITVPTTYVWGRHDPYLGRAGAERTAHYCRGDYRFVELDADHWLPEKCPDQVVEAVLDRVRGR